MRHSDTWHAVDDNGNDYELDVFEPATVSRTLAPGAAEDSGLKVIRTRSGRAVNVGPNGELTIPQTDGSVTRLRRVK
jgi:hypothetical protein